MVCSIRDYSNLWPCVCRSEPRHGVHVHQGAAHLHRRGTRIIVGGHHLRCACARHKWRSPKIGAKDRFGGDSLLSTARPTASSAAVRARMQKQRRRDTDAEMQVRRRLHAAGIRYRVDSKPEPDLRTRGDIVWRGLRVVVFIDGCYWHGCPLHATRPKANAQWWARKLDGNVATDRRNDAALTARGWLVLRYWEHEPAGDVGPTKETDGTVGASGATCIACETAVDLKYVRAEACNGRLGATLMSTVAQGGRRRVYLPSSDTAVKAADVRLPPAVPSASIPPKAPSFRVQAYGMTKWSDLFTNRQLTALTTFSDLVSEARDKALR